MKYFLLGSAFLLSFGLNAFEYEVQFENDQVCVAKGKIMGKEEVGLHRDAYPQVVIAIKGGIITRLEADGTENEIAFPTGIPVFREMDPPNELHAGVNKGEEPVELIIVQLKTGNVVIKHN